LIWNRILIDIIIIKVLILNQASFSSNFNWIFKYGSLHVESEHVSLIIERTYTADDIRYFLSLFIQFSALPTESVTWEISNKATLQSHIKCKTMYTKVDIREIIFVSNIISNEICFHDNHSRVNININIIYINNIAKDNSKL